MDRVKQLRRLFVSLIAVSCLSSVLYFHRGITEFGFTIWLASKVPTYLRHPCVHGTDNSSSSVEISPSTSRCHFPPCLVCPSALQNVTSLIGIREVLSREIDLKSTMTIFKDNLDVTLEYCCRQFSTRKEIPDRSRRKYNQYFRTIGRQKSCAIVGASGILLNSRCGREIDGHDFVMRINLAPTAGFEKDVGGRTNLTAVNNIVMHRVRRYLSNPDDEVQKKRNEKLFHSLKSINNSIVWFGYNITEKIYLMHFAKKDLMRMKNYKRVMNLNYTLAYSLVPIWSRIVNRFWRKTDGTSEGFLIFTVATLFCDKITMYGFWPFDVDSRGRRIIHHYYENRSTYTGTRGFVMSEENSILRELHYRGIITMVTGDCEK